jgi:hypothetical protein
LLAIQATRCIRRTAIAGKPAPTGIWETPLFCERHQTVGASLLAIQATRCIRHTAIAGKPAPTFNLTEITTLVLVNLSIVAFPTHRDWHVMGP